jgi:hypothetical protein
MTTAPPDETVLQACADAIGAGLAPPVRAFVATPVTSAMHDYAFMCHPDVPAPLEGDLLYIPATAASQNQVIVQVTQVDRPSLGDYIVRANIVWP